MPEQDMSSSGSFGIPGDGGWKVMADWLVKLLFPVLSCITGWAVLEILDHKSRITTIEASRYTSKDAIADRKDAVAQARAISESLTKIREALVREQVANTYQREQLTQMNLKLTAALNELRRKKD